MDARLVSAAGPASRAQYSYSRLHILTLAILVWIFLIFFGDSYFCFDILTVAWIFLLWPGYSYFGLYILTVAWIFLLFRILFGSAVERVLNTLWSGISYSEIFWIFLLFYILDILTPA
jgi:hypothetical protein